MRPQILLVDDNVNITEPTAAYLQLKGYDVDCVTNLNDAIRALDSRRYSMIITDVKLSSSNPLEGLELAALVKAKFLGIPVLLLTASGSTDLLMQARSAGVRRIISKPQPLALLAETISLELQSPK